MVLSQSISQLKMRGSDLAQSAVIDSSSNKKIRLIPPYREIAEHKE